MKIPLFFVMFIFLLCYKNLQCSEDFFRGVEVGATSLSILATVMEVQKKIASADSASDALVNASGGVILGALQLGLFAVSLNSNINHDATCVESHTCPVVSSNNNILMTFNCVYSILNIVRICSIYSYQIDKYKWHLEQTQHRLQDAENLAVRRNDQVMQDLARAVQYPVAGIRVYSDHPPVGRLVLSSDDDNV